MLYDALTFPVTGSARYRSVLELAQEYHRLWPSYVIPTPTEHCTLKFTPPTKSPVVARATEDRVGKINAAIITSPIFNNVLPAIRFLKLISLIFFLLNFAFTFRQGSAYGCPV